MSKAHKMTREHVMADRTSKQSLTALQREDIGRYARTIGVLPRYLVGSQSNPTKGRKWKTGSKEVRS